MGLFDAAPVLPGWITLTEAARRIGVSKQAVHKMVNTGKITTVHKVGEKPLYLMREAELTRLLAARESSARS